MTRRHIPLLISCVAFVLMAPGCAAPTAHDAVKPTLATTKAPSPAPVSFTDYPAIGVIKLIQVGEVLSSKNQAPGIRKELVYTGNFGYVINFVYKEFRDNGLQASVTEEVKYEVSKTGKYFSYRGARFEMRSVSSTSLVYKTLKQFY